VGLLLLAGCTLRLGFAAVDTGLEALRRDGERRLEEFDYDGALADFDRLLAAHREGRVDPWQADGLALLAAAFEGRAVALLGAGDDEAALAALEAGLDAHPGFAPERDRNSPRLLEMFDGLAARRIGRLTVRTEPAGGAVWIEGHRVGETPLEQFPWYAGQARLRIERPGHEPWIAVVDLAPGGTAFVERRLLPNARSLVLRTSPPGVAVWVDGVRRAISQAPTGAEVPAPSGARPDQVSGEVFLEHLPPGSHALKLERPCYETRDLTVNVEVNASANQPLVLETVMLEPSLATLEVFSQPQGASVTIDGVDVGRTPLLLPAACAGSRRIELRGEHRGLWSGPIDLAPGDRRRLDLVLLPTLLFAGVRGPDPAAARELEDRIIAGLAGIEGYNVLRMQGGVPPADAAAQVALLTDLGADLGLVAQVGGDGQVELALVSRDLAVAESAHASRTEPDPVEGFLRRLRLPTRPLLPWIGVTLVDSRIDPGPVVGRVFPSGPAHLAGLLPGDQILSVDGQPVGEASEVSGILERASRADIRVVVRRGGEERGLTVAIASTPVLLPAGDPERSYHRMLVDLDYVPDRDARPEARAAAALNRALALLHLGRCDLALAEPLAEASWPAGPGISAGTFAYLRGLCYERLGLEFRDEARRAFGAAAEDAGATLRTHDGPEAAPLARTHLAALAGG
jgi:hypothetical protein